MRHPRLPLTPLVVCAAVLAAGYLGFNAVHYVTHNYRVHQDEARLRAEIASLERDKQQLTAVRDYLKSDEYVEDIARRVLGLVRPGETLVIVSSSAPVTAPTPDAEPTPGGAWWKDLYIAGAAAPTPTPAGSAPRS